MAQRSARRDRENQYATSVDAPVRARENVGTFKVRGRMLPSVRPRYDGEPPLGPYGSSRTESTSTRRARGTLLHTGSPDPVSPTVAPYNFLPFAPRPRGR
jgi:hypothetical protein